MTKTTMVIGVRTVTSIVAIADEIRALFARMRSRPRPAAIDVTVLTPITMVVFVILASLTLLLLVADVINPVVLNL
jgi:hypothetical protein